MFASAIDKLKNLFPKSKTSSNDNNSSSNSSREGGNTSRRYDDAKPKLFKALLAGQSGVGKSNILLRFSDDEFFDPFIPTIGVDFRIRTITDSKGDCVKVQCWDTSGQERFETITREYYKELNGILFVFDVTDPYSLQYVEHFLDIYKRHRTKEAKMVLLGNKIDLVEKRQIDCSTAANYAADHGMSYFEVSAKDSISIEAAMAHLIEEDAGLVFPNEEILTKFAGRQGE